MSKKSFSKLGVGSGKLSDDLQSFLIKNDESQVHPDTGILDITKETIKEQHIPATLKKVLKKETPVLVKINQEKKPQLISTPKVQKELPKETQKAKTKIAEKAKPVLEEPADDFRSHSILFNEKQLSDLQEKVLMRKIHSDKKYSMKKALQEAFSLWLDHDGIVKTQYPMDFKTYTALFSEKQLNSVQDKVYMHKAKEDRGYSLKKALYEAVELYLKS